MNYELFFLLSEQNKRPIDKRDKDRITNCMELTEVLNLLKSIQV